VAKTLDHLATLLRAQRKNGKANTLARRASNIRALR
jgi:hypothetical protein